MSVTAVVPFKGHQLNLLPGTVYVMCLQLSFLVVLKVTDSGKRVHTKGTKDKTTPATRNTTTNTALFLRVKNSNSPRTRKYIYK